MMKILMIHPHDIYSNLEPWTIRITNIAKEFVKRDCQVKLVYHLLDTTLPPEVAAERQEFEFETIPLIRFQRTLLKKLKIMNQLVDWADVVHFQKCFPHAALPAVWASYRLGKPVHYDWDDWEYEIYNYRPNNKWIGGSINTFEKSLPSLVDTVSVASEALRKLCLECGVREDKIFEAHVGADLQMFHPDVDGSEVRRMHDIEGPIVLYLGQLHGAQYAELFLQAAKRILSRRSDVNFLVVGSGDRFGELHGLTESLGIGHKVIFTGAVSHEMVPKYIAAADIAVACFEDTKQTRCKSPLKVVEYLASGKAIVASNMGEVPKMLHECGILAKPGDVGSLANGIDTLLNNPELREELGKKVRKRAEEKYNWGVTASNILQAYDLGLKIRHIGLRKNKEGTKAQRHKGTEDEISYKKNSSNILIQRREQNITSNGSSSSKIQQFWKNNRYFMGMMDGQKVYSGPFLVQLDVTNRCNNDCLACWCRSPLLSEKIMDPETQKQTLSFERVSQLLEELHQMGTQEIYIAGGGEPFMHPQFMEILRIIKNYGMIVYINTNFTLVDKKKAEQIVDLGVDHLTISLWAGTPETYSKCHPNKTEETFHQIVDVVKYLVSIKEERPFIKLYNVISKVNYHEIEQMVDIACETGVESVEFTMVDTIPGYTDTLLLSKDERIELIEISNFVQEKVEKINKEKNKNLILFRFDEFIRRISTEEDTLEGHYDKNIVDSIPCYVGWFFVRILPDGNVNSCLKSHRIPIGNIYNQSFKEIWASEKQAEFRRKTKVYKKDDPYFSLIGNDPCAKVGCYKSCDNLGHNQHVHKILKSMGFGKKLLLHSGRYFMKPYN